MGKVLKFPIDKYTWRWECLAKLTRHEKRLKQENPMLQ